MKKIIVLAFTFIACFLTSQAQEKLEPKGQIPILAWFGIPANETTVERFTELKDAGFTMNFSSYSNIAEMDKAIYAAHKAGIKIIVSCPELKENPENTVKHFMNNPTVAGYFLRDEPNCKDFADLATWYKRIRAVDNKKFCYLNLFPNYADEKTQLGDTYPNYVQRFIDEVGLPLLSFDFYPIVKDQIRPNWYQNLEIIAEKAKKTNTPFWAFALATTHADYPVPTLASLRLQLYSDLAYGAQGLQYFTYWNPSNDPVFDFNHAPIGLDGKRTDVYDLVREINHEIETLSGVFLNAKIISVFHTGDKAPTGTHRLAILPDQVNVLDTHGSQALVSELTNDGKHFIVIQNCDIQKSMQLTFHANGDMKRILKDGTIVSANLYTTTSTVLPGDIIIYMY